MEDGDEIDAMLHQTGGGHKFLWMHVHLFWNVWENNGIWCLILGLYYDYDANVEKWTIFNMDLPYLLVFCCLKIVIIVWIQYYYYWFSYSFGFDEIVLFVWN